MKTSLEEQNHQQAVAVMLQRLLQGQKGNTTQTFNTGNTNFHIINTITANLPADTTAPCFVLVLDTLNAYVITNACTGGFAGYSLTSFDDYVFTVAS